MLMVNWLYWSLFHILSLSTPVTMWEVVGVFIPPHCDCCCCSGKLELRPLPKLQHQQHNLHHKYYCTLLFEINLSSGFVFYRNVRISVSERRRKTYSGGRKLKWTKFTLTLTTFKTFHSFSLFVPGGKRQKPRLCSMSTSCVLCYAC